jgi:hypothetical protein
MNRRLAEWIDQGLKYARWPPPLEILGFRHTRVGGGWPLSRAARVALVVALALLLVGVYLVQSSQIVTTGRYVEMLRRDLAILRRENALRLTSIAEAASAAKLLERAAALGFQPAERVEFVTVPAALHDDAPSLPALLFKSSARFVEEAPVGDGYVDP